MRFLYICSCMIILWFGQNLYGEQVITLFLRPYPALSASAKAEKLRNKIAHPSKRARIELKKMFSQPGIISGVFATYAGFLTVSDLNGEIEFPRKHPSPHIDLVIAQRITPIVRSANTLSHWEINFDYAHAFYSIIKYSVPKTGTEYFITQPKAAPDDGVIPLESIVLFADPKSVYVPIGQTRSSQSPHLQLPDIYIKNTIQLTSEDLYVLNVMQYWGLIKFIYQKEPKRYSSHLVY